MGWKRPHSSKNPNRRAAAPKEGRRTITWKDSDEKYGLAIRERPGAYINPGSPTGSFKQTLHLGGSFTARFELSEIERDVRVYPFPTLRIARNQDLIVVPRGMSMIYAGTVRVTERARVARQQVDLEVPKHTFVIPFVGRCIIHDLRLVKPM